MDRVKLRRILARYFNAGELRTLCFDLGIDYDDLPGEGKTDKARGLVSYLERRDRIPELIKLGKQVRPNAPWDEVSEAIPGASSTSPDRSRAEIESLRRQLAEEEENLLLIEEQKSKFVLETDVPLHLIKEEREKRNKIAALRTRLAELEA